MRFISAFMLCFGTAVAMQSGARSPEPASQASTAAVIGNPTPRLGEKFLARLRSSQSLHGEIHNTVEEVVLQSSGTNFIVNRHEPRKTRVRFWSKRLGERDLHRMEVTDLQDGKAQATIICDGTQVWEKSSVGVIAPYPQNTSGAASDRRVEFPPELAGCDFMNASRSWLGPSRRLMQFTGEFARAQFVGLDELGGATCFLLSYQTPAEKIRGSWALEKFWLNEEFSLVGWDGTISRVEGSSTYIISHQRRYRLFFDELIDDKLFTPAPELLPPKFLAPKQRTQATTQPNQSDVASSN